MAKNQIEMTKNDTTSVVDVMADVDFTLNGNEGDAADFATVVQQVVLARCEGQAKLPLGNYNIRLLAVITKEGT